MNGFLQDAANIFDVATNVAQAGYSPGDTAVLIGADGSIRVVCGSEWPIDALRRLHGTSVAYRVSTAGGVISVTGESVTQRCRLESKSPSHAAQRLLRPGYCLPLCRTANLSPGFNSDEQLVPGVMLT